MELTNAPAVTVLTEDESWHLLRGAGLGRLATSLAGQPEIFPVNFISARPTLLFRTAEGTKLLSAVMNAKVAFEADEHDGECGWSVVVKGSARVLSSDGDIELADSEALAPWVPTIKQRYVRIDVAQISGRRFVFGPEPDPLSELDASD